MESITITTTSEVGYCPQQSGEKPRFKSLPCEQRERQNPAKENEDGNNTESLGWEDGQAKLSGEASVERVEAGGWGQCEET